MRECTLIFPLPGFSDFIKKLQPNLKEEHYSLDSNKIFFLEICL
jgi:hypothetical protein